MNHKQSADHVSYSWPYDFSSLGLSRQQARRVYLELLAPERTETESTNELLELNIDASLPALFGPLPHPPPPHPNRRPKNDGTRPLSSGSTSFRCKCARLSIDQQRQQYLLASSEKKPAQINNGSGEMETIENYGMHNFAELGALKLMVAGRDNARSSWRRKLLSRFALRRRRRWCHGQLDDGKADEIALYALEPLIEAADRNLANHLRSEASKLDQIQLDPAETTLMQPLKSSVMIRAPIGSSEKFDFAQQSRQDSGLDSVTANSSTTSSSNNINSNWMKIKQSVGFRSSEQVQSIVGYSVSFLEKLISESPLLQRLLGNNKRLTGVNPPMSLHEFKLTACVECQRLRASIRFDWLPHCLLLAFGAGSNNKLTTEHKRRRFRRPEGSQPEVGGSLPPLDGSPSWNIKYHRDALAMLMGQLLRRHFLEPALELLCSQLNHFATTYDTEPILSLPIELQEDQSTGKVHSSQADLQLKLALEFVVDELGSVCSNLPRPNQLNSTMNQIHSNMAPEANRTTPADPGSPKDECSMIDSAGTGQDYLVVLHDGDGLLERAKIRLRIIIVNQSTSQRQTWEMVNIDSHRTISTDLSGSELPDASYGLAIDLVNLLRSSGSDQEELNEHLEELLLLPSGRLSSTRASKHESPLLKQMRISSSQIYMVDLLRLKLIKEAPRYVRLVLAKLDHEPLRVSLITCLERERNLLVRLNSDAIMKLMSRLRLQFDEIELGCDLESSIEDYLNDKWQAKQSQHLDERGQILLADDENVDANLEFRHLDELDQHDNQEQLVRDEPSLVAQDGTCSGPKVTEASDEDRFLEEIMITNLNGMQTNTANEAEQLVTMQTSLAAQAASGGSGRANRRVAPLIECRLLVNRYQYLDKLLREDLDQFVSELDEVFQGLVFLSEFCDGIEQLDLVSELSLRAQSFSGDMLTVALKRLESARESLYKLNQLRQEVLDQIFVEFHLLMMALSKRKLVLQEKSDNTDDNGQTIGNIDCIGMLDGFQESSELAAKLELRCQFLDRQNTLLEKELSLLEQAKLKTSTGEPSKVDFVKQSHFMERSKIISNWQSHVSLMASFWGLVEDFEFQQLRWLNFDTKKLEFSSIEREFSSYTGRLDLIEANFSEDRCDEMSRTTFRANIDGLRLKFGFFQKKRLPLFKFLTNKHLTKMHWLKLSKLLALDAKSSGQTYTTLAQFLEIHIDDYVGELESLDKQATMEHELSVFLLIEADQLAGSITHNKQIRSLDVSSFLESWSNEELEIAASRYVECKLNQTLSEVVLEQFSAHSRELARQLVTVHSSIRRYLSLVYNLNLDFCHRVTKATGNDRAHPTTILRSSTGQLNSPNNLRASYFIEYIRLFTHKWIESQQDQSKKQKELEDGIRVIKEHLGEIHSLVERVDDLERNELKQVNDEINNILVRIGRESLELELKREILATREVVAIDRQREAELKRDHCIQQITQRAIPALRAATKALSCLDGRAIRSLRNLRPNPPEPVRQVIEAVCLLRSCVVDKSHPLSPERKFDSLKGAMISDYWPNAYRMINGRHSSKFLADLAMVNKRMIPPEVMRLIRRRYLSSAKFKLNLIENVSHECAHLAKWLIAVDVFDRVINIVRPNYRQYNEAEQKLGGLLDDVSDQRHQIESIESHLSELEDLFRVKVSQKTSLGELIEDCKEKAFKVGLIKDELVSKYRIYSKSLKHLKAKERKLAIRCILEAAESIYINKNSFMNMRDFIRKLHQDILSQSNYRVPITTTR